MVDIEVEIPKKAFLPAYHHLLESTSDINLLWGGRDSGKSHFIAQKLLYKCLSAPYFRCILIKKTANTIEASQWQTLKDIATKWGIKHLFKFKTHPLSIECINGNTFLARGLDDADNIKSVKDPTDVWYEEMNQATLTDFITVATTLRSEEKVQQWGSLNPETETGDYEEFWIYKTFFKPYVDQGGNIYKTFTGEWWLEIPDEEPVLFSFTCTHTTYHDNPNCKPERKAFLEQLKELDAYYYEVFTKGRWGKKQTGGEFYKKFVRHKHVGTAKFLPGLPVHVSFDFNVLPYMTMLAAQIHRYENDKLTVFEVRIFQEYCLKDPENTTEDCCLNFINDYGNEVTDIFFYGDAMGNKRHEGTGNKTEFKKVKELLVKYIDDSSDRTWRANPSVLQRRTFMNKILAEMHIVDDVIIKILIDSSCKETVKDFENVKLGENGKLKQKYTDPKTKQVYEVGTHCTDAADYLVTKAFEHYFKAVKV